MGYKEIRNLEPPIKEECFWGRCKRFGEKATVIVHYRGSTWCETDIHKTYRKAGVKCSLLEGTNEAKFSPCMENCSLVPGQYL